MISCKSLNTLLTDFQLPSEILLIIRFLWQILLQKEQPEHIIVKVYTGSTEDDLGICPYASKT